MNLKETVCEVADWTHVTEDAEQCRAVVKTVMNF
jgi:hypothetical protein